MFVPVFDPSPLLRRAGVCSDEAAQNLAEQLNTRTRTSGLRVRGWLDGAPVAKVEQLQALLAVLDLPAEEVRDLVPSVHLVWALWNAEMGGAMRERRREQRLTVAAVAKRAQVAEASLVRWESAKTLPRLDGLVRVLGLLELDAAALVDRADWSTLGGPRGAGRALAELLRTARTGAGLSQRQLAERIGVSQPLLVQWEIGRSYPDPARWERLARVLTELGTPVSVTLLEDWRPWDRLDAQAVPALPPIARLLLTARRARGLNKRQTAAAMGVSLAALAHWETGTAVPMARQWPTIRSALGLSMDEVTDLLAEAVYARRVGIWPRALARAAALGMTEADLGAAMGVSDSAVAKWSRGTRPTGAWVPPALVRTLRCSHRDLDPVREAHAAPAA